MNTVTSLIPEPVAGSDNSDHNLKMAIITLYKAGSFVGSKRFLTLFNSENFRFNGNSGPLFAKLRHDFLFQICQSLNGDFTRGWRQSSTLGIPVNVAAPQMARQLVALADSIKTVHIKAADKRFTVSRNDELLPAVFSTFNSSATMQACVELARLDTPYNSIRTFEERNFLSSFGVFVECLNTLAFETSYPGYETMLATLFQDVAYFVNGYPCDILAHDARILREKDDVTGIMVREEYCASASIRKNSTMAPQEGFVMYPV